MSDYGIKILWAGWGHGVTDDRIIGFSNRAYNRFKDTLHIGTKMLLYESSFHEPAYPHPGKRQLIGEVEIVKMFNQMAGAKTPTQQHYHALEVKPLLTPRDVKPVPLSRIREIIKEMNFPWQGVAWVELDKETYMKLRDELLRK